MLINCIAINDQLSSRKLIEEIIRKNPELQLLAMFDNRQDALKFVEQNQVSLLLSTKTAVPVKQDFFFADANGKRLKINVSDIAYIKSAGNYVLIVGHKLNVIIYKSMHAMLELLPSGVYIRIHKSYIISINFIEAIRGNECLLRLNDTVQNIPIGKKFKTEFFHKLEHG